MGRRKMLRVEIEWDEDSVEHIAKHLVEPEEVEQVLSGRYLLLRGRQRRYYVLGRTEAYCAETEENASLSCHHSTRYGCYRTKAIS